MRQRFVDAIEELGDACFVDGFDRWQFHRFNWLARCTLNCAQHTTLTRRHEQNRITLTTCTARTANAMHVAFGIVRNVVIQNVRNAFHIETTCSDVGGDEDIDFAILQLLDRALALRLLHITVDRRSGDATCRQLLSKFFSAELGARKNNHRIKRFRFNDARDCVELVHAADRPITLTDVVTGRRLRLDRDLNRILQIRLRDALDRRWHRCGKQCNLTSFRGFLKNRFDVINEAHAQHFIGFIEDEALEFRQIQRATLKVIDDATWRTDNDLHTALQRLQLRVIALAAVDWQDLEAWKMGCVFLECFSNLDRQFTRWGEDESLWLLQLRINVREDWQCKRGGLARAGLCLTQHVATFHQWWNRGGLDRGWGFVTDVIEGLQDRLAQI